MRKRRPRVLTGLEKLEIMYPTDSLGNCSFCGLYHDFGILCPRVEALEYEEGDLKRIVLTPLAS